MSIAGSILVNSDQTRHAAAFLILTSDGMSWSFWCDHEDIDVSWGNDLTVMNIETMSKNKAVASFKVW